MNTYLFLYEHFLYTPIPGIFLCLHALFLVEEKSSWLEKIHTCLCPKIWQKELCMEVKMSVDLLFSPSSGLLSVHKSILILWLDLKFIVLLHA